MFPFWEFLEKACSSNNELLQKKTWKQWYSDFIFAQIHTLNRVADYKTAVLLKMNLFKSPLKDYTL